MNRTLVFLSLLAIPQAAEGQTRLIIGRADDSLTTNPLVSGVVQVLGTTIRAPINYDGTFALHVPVREVTLKVTSVGYRAREVRVTADMVAIRVPVLRDHFRMDELVVEGRGGGVERRNLAHAIGEVRAEDLTRVPAGSMGQVLSGRVPGAQFTQGNAAPGVSASVRLRGITSILGNVEPLYVLDGVIVSSAAIPNGTSAITKADESPQSRITDINPNDIEKIEILKGAAAATLYGSRGSNGVVLITTKRGGQQN